VSKLIFLLLLARVRAIAQTVEGTVLDAATGAGIAGVKVELLRQTTPFYETATDGGGRFRFDHIPENDYSIRYQSPDYWLTAGPTDYRPFHVGATDPVKLEARLMPWSKISGRVVDPRGNPVANAMVEISAPGMVANGRTYVRSSWGGGGGGQLTEIPMNLGFHGNTDARGRFEVSLMPGAYGLCADAPPKLKPPEPEESRAVLAWKRTCYPGVDRPEEASKVVVAPGGEVPDVELKLRAIPARAVRGMVLNPDGTPSPWATIRVGDGLGGASAESRPDGTFELPAVPEGGWRIVAIANKPAELRATGWIEIGRHDLEDLKLRLAAPLSIRGRVVTDAPPDGPFPRIGPLVLATREDPSGPGAAPGLTLGVVLNPNAQGNFSAEAYPGLYHATPTLQPSPPPYYLDSVVAGGANLITQEIEISSDTAITLIYKTDGGSVAGKVENCNAGGVLLMPADPALRGKGFSRAAPCDAAGAYEVRALRPGDYYALAFAGNGVMPPVDDALLSRGIKVTVKSGQASTADLRTVTRPAY
jgi:hypothetical protein